MLNITIILLTVSFLCFCINMFFNIKEFLQEETLEDFEAKILYRIRLNKKQELEKYSQNKYKRSYTISELEKIRNRAKKKEPCLQISNYSYETRYKPISIPKDSKELKHLKLAFNYINNYQYNLIRNKNIYTDL